jgi:hypothetical protein
MEPAIHRKSERRLWTEILVASAVLAAIAVSVVTFATHVLGPVLFTHYDRFPALADIPKITRNARGAYADPVNA